MHLGLKLFQKWHGPADPGFRLEVPGATPRDVDLTAFDFKCCNRPEHLGNYCAQNGLELIFRSYRRNPLPIWMEIVGHSPCEWEQICDRYICRGKEGAMNPQ